MIRLLFTGLLLLHGLIHLLNFVSQWHLATVSQLSGKALIPLSEQSSRLPGLPWLVSCLGFVLAAAGYGLRRDWWMAATLGSLLISQTLLILYWPDAKAVTVTNVVIAVVLLLTYMNVRFDRQTDQEARQLLDQTPRDGTIVTADRLAGLPEPVQDWLIRLGVVGKEYVYAVWRDNDVGCVPLQ